MLYNNDPRKVEALDQMLFKKFGTNREFEDKDGYFEDFELDYLQHVIPPDKLDEVIFEIACAISSGDNTRVSKALNITNPPVLYKGNLVFGMNKYLHWFRGYYYQVSYTPDGHYTVQSPYFWMDKLLHLVYSNARRTCDTYTNVEEFVLTISALSTSLNYYDSMKRMISTPDGVAAFDEFLVENRKKYSRTSYDFNTQKVLDLLEEYTCEHIPADILVQNAVVIRNEFSDNNICILSVTDTHIVTVIRTHGKFKVIKFTLPDWYTDASSVYDEEFGENPYKNTPDAMEIFVQFVLYYSGVYTHSIGMYPLGGEINRKYSIHANIKSVSNAEDLANFIAHSICVRGG